MKITHLFVVIVVGVAFILFASLLNNENKREETSMEEGKPRGYVEDAVRPERDVVKTSEEEIQYGQKNPSRTFLAGHNTEVPGTDEEVYYRIGEKTKIRLLGFYEKTLDEGETLSYHPLPGKKILLRGSDELILFLGDSKQHIRLEMDKWHLIKTYPKIKIWVNQPNTFIQIGCRP